MQSARHWSAQMNNTLGRWQVMFFSGLQEGMEIASARS
jgi:hypothetical protein